MKRLLIKGLFCALASVAVVNPASAYFVLTCNAVPIERSNLFPQFRANFFAGDNPAGDFDEAIQIFNQNTTNMNYQPVIDYGDYTMGLDNGHTEVWPYLELTPADIFNSDQFAALGGVFLDGCDIDEGDVVFNLAYQWAHTDQKSDYNAYGDGSPDISSIAVSLHELGHTLGFLHDCSTYNIMGDSLQHMWANGPDAGSYSGEGLTDGIIDLYSDEGPATLQERDVSVVHWRYDSCNPDGYSVHTRTAIFNLAGDELPKVPGEVEPRFIAAAGQTIDAFFTFENLGTTIEEGVEVGVFYSDDDTITTMDTRIGGTSFDFFRNDPDTRPVTVNLPLDLPQGDGYLGVIVDENDSLDEPREHNNASYIGMRIEGQDADGDGEPDDGSETFYRYAAKVVCGVQTDPVDLRLRPGVYATTVNIFNPDPETVRFDKRLAVSYPPDPQVQGDVFEFGFDSLDPLHALETNCDDLVEKAYDGQFPAPYFEGFVVITSPKSLDVTAVYSGSSITLQEMAAMGGDHPDDFTDREPCGYGHCGCCCCPHRDDPGNGGGGGGGLSDGLTLDVEQIKERIIEGMPPPDDNGKKPDLVPEQPFPDEGSGPPSGYCLAPDNPPGQAEKIRVIVRNQGAAPAGPSKTSVAFGIDGALPPPDSAIKIADTPGLVPGATASHEFRIPDSCYGPPETQCRFVVAVDGSKVLDESSEGNNIDNSLCVNFHVEG